MSYHRRYKVKDHQFAFHLLQLREKASLTQGEIASALQVTERTIQYWEGGTSRPSLANLRKLIALYLSYGAFTPHRECDEARELWEQVCLHTSHWQIPFNENWFNTLPLPQNASDQDLPQESNERLGPIQLLPQRENTSSPPSLHRVDWGEATDISSFYGREQELAALEQWILTDQCRLIALLGMGGIGKTVLSVKIAQYSVPHFDFVFWRSMRNAPPFEDMIVDCIQFISGQPYTQLSREKSIPVLIDLLQAKRCLLIFDNMDILLQEGNLLGHYREGYEEYGVLIQRIGEIKHRSCLLLTSREMLSGLDVMDGISAPVRILKVAGLGPIASQDMLKGKGLFGESHAWSMLIDHYAGNPLALKIVAESVRELFGGDIAAFLREGYVIFHDILLLLNYQFERLSPLEQNLMYWLSIERDPVSLDELSTNFIYPPSKSDLLEALKSLLRRCLIERGEQGAIFTLQPVILEYVTERLVEHITTEVSQGHLTFLMKYALMKSQAKDYIRHSQIRLLLQPTLKRLLSHFGSKEELERHFVSLLAQLRTRPRTSQGYGGGNIVNLLAHLKGNIRGIDFSHLMIRQAYLQELEAQDANFTGADLTNSVFMGVLDSISAVTLSQDGKYLIAGSFNGQLCLWRIADGKPLLIFKGHASMIWSVAFSPDEKLFASGSYDHHVKLWDVGSGHCIRMLKAHTEWVRSVKFSPDGTLLATCADDQTVRIWQVQDGTCLHTLRGHSSLVWSVAFHPNGKLLVSGSLDKTVRLWDVASGDCLGTLHTERVYCVVFSPNGKLLASGGDGISIWDWEKQQLLNTWLDGTSLLWTLTFISEGTLASGSNRGKVALWDIFSGQCLRTLQNQRCRIWSVAFAPTNLLATGNHDGVVTLWDTINGHCIKTFQGYNRVISALAFSPDGRILVDGDDHGIIHIWEMSSGRCIKSWQGHSSRIWSLTFSLDGSKFASGENNFKVKVWDTLSGLCLNTFEEHIDEIWSLALNPAGDILASGGLDYTIKLWRTGAPGHTESMRTLPDPSWIWSLTFSPDGTILASGGEDGAVTLWDSASGTRLHRLESSDGSIGALIFSHDGKTLASCSSNEVMRVWDVESGRCLSIMQGLGNANWVKSLAFSSDGATLASGRKDRTLKIWNLHNEHDTKILTGHKAGIWSVAFSPDGSILASGGDDGAILLWTTQTGEQCGRLRSDGPFERMNIYGAVGITQAQKASLEILGAIEVPDGRIEARSPDRG